MPRRKKEPEKLPRRKRGTGAVHRRKDREDGKSWQYSYFVNGVRITGYAETYEEADRLVLAAIAESKRTGAVPTNLTVGEYLGLWLESRTDLRANTRYDWGLIVKGRYAPIADIPLTDLVRRHVQEKLVDEWTEEGLAPSTIRRVYLVPLKQAIIGAIQDDLISHNPCAYIRYPKTERIEDEEEDEDQVVLNIEQSKALIKQLDGHWLQRMVIVDLALGLRGGELRALKWKDINWEAGTVRVRRNVSQVPGQAPVEDLPKSKRGRRMLTIPDFALTELKQHRIEQNELRLKAGKAWQDLDLVFCQEDGTHIRRNAPGEQLELACKYAGLPRIKFHGLRKSTGSILLALGVDIATVSRILGHAHPGITWSVYAHMLPGRDDDAMDRYGRAFSG
jgi:integrase